MKKICFISGSRADFGLLKSLMQYIQKDKNFLFQLLVTGSHLSKSFGFTYKEILKFSFKINGYINIKIKGDEPNDICKSTSIAVDLFSKKFKKLKPDIIVLLGDRYEIFAACSSALIHRIPVCHLHGGELTRGAFDNSLRHSITKMSHIHLVANKKYAQRIKQLGENPKNIFTVGGFGVDQIKKTILLNKKELEKKIKFKFGKKNLLVTDHPVTLEDNTSKKQITELLKALDQFKDTKIIFTKTNADTNGKIINTMIEKFVKKNKSRCCSFKSMGIVNYLSTLNIVDGVVGNSSSGLLEAPTFKIGSVNIGDRQKDRLKAISIIDCLPYKRNIISSIKKIYTKNFIRKIKKMKNPYGIGGASFKAYKILKKMKTKNLIKKKFYDQI